MLISHEERPDRRRFNEEVLDTGKAVHDLAGELLVKVREEADALVARTHEAGSMGWDEFIEGWWRLVRRIVLGDAAREDHAVSDLLAELRADANWAYLKPKRTAVRERFLRQLQGHLNRGEPGSLAALVASTSATHDTAPVEQVPQWLFAFEPAGMATFRALALLDAHPEQRERAVRETEGLDLSSPHGLPFLRACVLESVRLWPTTPAILRDTTAETSWETGTLPAGSALLIFAPFFHRDDQKLPH